MLTLVLLSVFLICVVALWFQGLWSNILILINIFIAALLASNFFEPLAAAIETLEPGGTYLYDFLSIWILFIVFYVICRMMTAWMSKHRVKFIMPVEMAGRTIFAFWASWVFICFVTMTLHVSPLIAHPFGGAFQTPTSSSFLGMSPDRQWLAIMQSRSLGALSRGSKHGEYASPHGDDKGKAVFDPQSEFTIKYHHRRKTLETSGDYFMR